MVAAKISTGKIDKAAPLAAFEGATVLYDADPLGIRVFSGDMQNLTQYSLGVSGTTTSDPLAMYAVSGALDDAKKKEVEALNANTRELYNEIAGLLPQLSDMSIKSQEIDYTTNPPTVKVVIRVKNSTGKDVISLKGLVSK